MQGPEDLEDFVCKEVESLCDADPKVLAQYIIALIGNEERNDELKSSLQDKLHEFFDDQTIPFIDRLFAKLNQDQLEDSNTSGGGRRFADFSDEEDDGDRNFKHRRQRSESREERMDQDRSKRRYNDDNGGAPSSSSATKYFRGEDYSRRVGGGGSGGLPSGPASMYNNNSSYDNRGRGGRGGSRGRGGSMMGRTNQSRIQCRDYNEKGFCMRGDMCPYDHGMDRIVVDEGGAPFPGSFPTGPMNTMGRTGPQPGFFGMPGMMGNSTDAYDPERAGLMAPGGVASGNTNLTGFTDMGMMGHADMGMMPNTMRGMGGSGVVNNGGVGRPHRGGRGGGRGGRGGNRNGGYHYHHSNNNPQNTTLTVEKIPMENCQISTVNDFFAKFGTITNISVQPHLQKAIIQYSTRAEAEAAYNSPDAIFDNRFVKVYWHKDDSATASTTSAATTGGSGQNTVPTLPEPPKSNEPDPELVAARAAELAREREEKQKKHNERMKTILELQKQKEHLLQLQIAEQKRLLAKLTDSTNLTTQEKEELLKALKKIQSDIDISRAGTTPTTTPAAAATATATPATTTSTTTATTTSAASGASTDNNTEDSSAAGDANKTETSEDLKKKLARLEAEAATLGIHTSASIRGGRGGYFARGSRGGWPRMRGGMTRMTLDNRPTKIQIKNIPEETNETELRQHFEQYGYMTSFEKNESDFVVQYSQRFEAEKAMAVGAHFPKGELELIWVTGSTTPATHSESATTTIEGEDVKAEEVPAVAPAAAENTVEST